MDIDIIKNKIDRLNPFNIVRKKRLRGRLKNHDMTILASNCIGGIIYNDLGLRFSSPTVNLMIPSNDFVKFCVNLEHYLQRELFFTTDHQEKCPVARLDDITVYFTHYASEAEARRKWEERKRRINPDNLFIITNDRDGVTDKDLEALGQIACRGIVVFSSKKHPDIPYCLYVDKFAGEPCVGNMLQKNRITGARLYERYFDYVSFFNNSNGNYDLHPFLLKSQ